MCVCTLTNKVELYVYFLLLYVNTDKHVALVTMVRVSVR